MCFGIRISSPFHLATLILPIENNKCPKNAKNACADALLGLFSGQFSSKDIKFASLLQVTSICVYNTVRPPQQRQGTPPVQEVKWKLIDLKFSSPEKWLISCKPGHLLIKTQLQLHVFLAFLGHLWFSMGEIMWLDETGSKFWFQNTRGKVKSDFLNRFELEILMMHFFWVTLNMCGKGFFSPFPKKIMQYHFRPTHAYIKLTLVSFC